MTVGETIAVLTLLSVWVLGLLPWVAEAARRRAEERERQMTIERFWRGDR